MAGNGEKKMVFGHIRIELLLLLFICEFLNFFSLDIENKKINRPPKTLNVLDLSCLLVLCFTLNLTHILVSSCFLSMSNLILC